MLVIKLRHFKICIYFHDSKTMSFRFRNDSLFLELNILELLIFSSSLLQLVEFMAIIRKLDIILV